MTSSRIEGPASRRLKISELPDRSRRNADRPSGNSAAGSFDGEHPGAVGV